MARSPSCVTTSSPGPSGCTGAPPPRPGGPPGRAALGIEKLHPHLALMQMHAVVNPAFSRQRTDERLAAVIEELDADALPHLGADLRRPRPGAGGARPA